MIGLRGFEDAIVGPARIWTQVDDELLQVAVLVYSGREMCRKLMADRGVSFEEAREAIEREFLDDPRSYVGPNTPIVVWPASELQEIKETLQ